MFRQKIPLQQKTWYADVPRQTLGPILAGVWISAATFGGFGLWAATAPIAGAVVTSGAFVATGQNKVVQNLEGGVISQILVREGDLVEPGQELLRLDETAAKADMRRLLLKKMRLEAVEARLLAEAGATRSLATPISYQPETSDPERNTVLENQRLTFESHRRSVLSDVTSLEEGIASLAEHQKGTQTQLASVVRQGVLYEQEIAFKKGLLEQGLIRRSEMLALERAKAAMDGEVGRLSGEIGDTKEKIGRANEQIAAVRNNAVKTAVEQLVDIRADLYDTRERMLTARNVVDRVKVTSPVQGVVVKLGYHTPGGVIEPGKPILEILPLNDELLIEAKVRSQDIDSVKKGADATVRLSALSARVTPMVKGKVIYVSADSIQEDSRVDRSAGVYVARIRIDKDQLPLIRGFVPTPGMPAEVYIKTGERTFFAYLMRPVRDSMARAFRER